MSEEVTARRPGRRRYRGVAAAVAIGLLAGVAGGFAAHRLWPAEADGGSGPQAAAPAGSVAEPIRAAMLAQRRVGVSVAAREGGETDFFTGQARLDLVDAVTARAATHVLYDMGEGHGWYPPEIVLIGGRAVITPDEEMTGPEHGRAGSYRTEPDAYAAAKDDVAVRNALETRWLAQPAHLVALLDHVTGLRTERAGGTRTLTGSTSVRTLAADPAIGRLYAPYGAARPDATVRFTLEVTARDLPRSLKTEVPTGAAATDDFTVEYRDWSRGAAITARPGPTPAPQWTAGD
ncbi:Tat pathway signal sequence domain protein OS=Streptomyces alboniger OX=132473 GN=CP975_02915 PE=4 SV=1 [Streptomyces alboniger]